MTVVPADTTRAILEEEAERALSWASRHGWELQVDLEALVVTGSVEHPVEGVGTLHLTGDVSGYRAIPPAWTFIDPETGQVTKQAFPAPGSGPAGSSIFHPKPVICAPFNRLAYKQHGGPHQDWSAPSNWMDVSGYVVAYTVADMLAVIDVHLRYSPGRMA